MITILYCCTECPAKDMASHVVIQHNTRTDHRYVRQTPEALLTRDLKHAKMEPEQIKMVVERVERALGDRIIDGTVHAKYCRCWSCQERFLAGL